MRGLKVFVDISTYCNAGCPQCHRTDERGLVKQDWLPLVQWDLETFKKAFPREQLRHIDRFKFCGTWGDPVMCKELMEICEYIILNSYCTISMDTNGSIRNPEWWWDLGVGCGNRLEVVFDVDGINQEMHEKYRRFTSLNKVLENMEMLSQTKAIVRSQTILFKHNQDYKDEIQQLCKDHGSTNHSFVISDRFESINTIDNKRYFYNTEGEKEFLEPADRDVLPDGKISGTEEKENSYEIRCRWAMPRNEVVVNPDGQVMPCCFHANSHYYNRFVPDKGKELAQHPLYMEEYNQNLEKYNVLHTPLDEIINSEWYRKMLPNSMKGNNPAPQCEKHCSNRVIKHHQIRVHNAT